MTTFARSSLLLALATTGCSLTQDFDRYSSARGVGDASVDATTDAQDAEDAPNDDVPCPSGQVRCGGVCRDTMNDRDHCGGCTSCEAQGFSGASRCVAGACSCRLGADKCGSLCTYLDSDPANCGACGAPVHDSSQTCAGGSPVCAGALRTCVDWSFPWMGGTVDVRCPTSSVCVDTGGEGNHCYQYGATTTYRRCYDAPQIGWCIDHDCTFAATATPNPCTSIPHHLECAVTTSPTDPDGDVRSCVDGSRDPNHCGACNHKCTGVDELCVSGTCTRYRAAHLADDCDSGWSFCTPPGWSTAVCVAGACPK